MSDPALFEGTAEYYERYRPKYGTDIIELLAKKFRLDGTGSLLDLGCGTGQFAIPLSPLFEEVIAVDADAGMLDVARTCARKAGTRNISWVRGRAEDFFPTEKVFRLVTIGKAFHFMDQELLVPRIRAALLPGGGVAIAQGRSWWSGTEEWQKAVIEVVKEFLGNQRRAGAGSYKPSEKKFEILLEESGFAVESLKFVASTSMDIESILGLLYSTSFASKELLGENIEKFEAKLRAVLLALSPDGKFIDQEPIWLIIASLAD